MNTPAYAHSPLVAFGMTSLVLGVIAILLFFLPILGIPISAFGLCFGILGFFAALLARGARLRWSLGGIVISALALGINIAVAYAPEGYLADRNVPKLWQPVPDRPYVPPPAPSRWVGDPGSGPASPPPSPSSGRADN
jgi:hypothetical protein